MIQAQRRGLKGQWLRGQRLSGNLDNSLTKQVCVGRSSNLITEPAVHQQGAVSSSKIKLILQQRLAFCHKNVKTSGIMYVTAY